MMTTERLRMPSLRRGETELYFKEASGEEVPILLAHGWCCDHSFFSSQFDHFASKGHRVLSVDLRGHGRSDKPHQSYSMEVFADDLAWLCEQRGLERPVVVGHSMGGVISFDLAARYPELPSAIAMLDAAVVLPSGARAAIPAFLERLRRDDYREVLGDYVGNAMFISSDDSDRKRQIIETMISAPQHVMVSAFEGLRDYDPTEATGGLAVPGVYIAADEAQPRSDMSGFHDLVPEVLYGKTVGSGHFCQMEVPEQINAMLDRFISIVASGL